MEEASFSKFVNGTIDIPDEEKEPFCPFEADQFVGHYCDVAYSNECFECCIAMNTYNKPKIKSYVYLVLEEYDPYCDGESRTELGIKGIFEKEEDAKNYRNHIIKAEVAEYNISDFNEAQLEKGLDFRINVLGSEYYISKMPVF